MKKIALLSVLLLASVAGAAVIEDFEGAYSGNGAIVADPENASNSVLQLLGGEAASFVPTGTAGIVTMDIYDFGEIAYYGPRWGVADAANSTSYGACIINRSGVDGTAGYGTGASTDRTGSWFTVAWLGGPRQVVALDDPATTETFEGVGQWTTWTFAVDAAGNVDLSAAGLSQSGTIASLGEIWVSGGKSGYCDMGVLVDNVTFAVPEPATLSMLALGGLAMLRRRK